MSYKSVGGVELVLFKYKNKLSSYVKKCVYLWAVSDRLSDKHDVHMLMAIASIYSIYAAQRACNARHIYLVAASLSLLAL